jgi:hypothetical protein
LTVGCQAMDIHDSLAESYKVRRNPSEKAGACRSSRDENCIRAYEIFHAAEQPMQSRKSSQRCISAPSMAEVAAHLLSESYETDIKIESG